jgi:DNA-directed RNA polymerase specialized sigma24 family protein
MPKVSLQRMGLSTHKQSMTGDQRSDGELLARLPRQPELMGVLYERHARAVFRYLARRAGPTAAEDLASEVFIAALSASSRVVVHDSGSALPWLYGIALNVLRKHFQKTRPVPGVAGNPGVDWDAVDDRLDAWAERGRLRAGKIRMTFPQVAAACQLLHEGGQGQDRTVDLPLFRRTLVPTELPDLARCSARLQSLRS